MPGAAPPSASPVLCDVSRYVRGERATCPAPHQNPAPKKVGYSPPPPPSACARLKCEAHRFCRWYSAPKCMYPCKPGEVERPIMMIQSIMAILNHGRLDHFRAKFRAAVYRNSVWDHAGQGTGVQSWVSHTFGCSLNRCRAISCLFLRTSQDCSVISTLEVLRCCSSCCMQRAAPRIEWTARGP